MRSFWGFQDTLFEIQCPIALEVPDELRGLRAQLWNTFNRKTRMCRTVKELMQQATWLVGQFKPNIFYTKWLASFQAEWLEECSRVEDVMHCKCTLLLP